MRSLGLFACQSGLSDLDQSQLLPSVGIRIYPRYSFFTINSATIKASKMPHEVTTYAMLSLTGINTCNHRLFHIHNQIVVLIWTYVAACLVDANSHRLSGGDIKGLTPSLRPCTKRGLGNKPTLHSKSTQSETPLLAVGTYLLRNSQLNYFF